MDIGISFLIFIYFSLHVFHLLWGVIRAMGVRRFYVGLSYSSGRSF